MFQKIANIGRLLFTLVYSLYAVVPISMYAVECGHSGGALSAKHSSRDIVWENVIFSSLGDDDGDDILENPSQDKQTAVSTKPDGGVVLVRKKRALLRQQPDINPNVEVQVLPPCISVHQPPAPNVAQAISHNPLLRKADGYYVLNSGLSPPVHTS